jgi:NADPH-dependent 2,4-dienoyl-CoA reductase/sulfur reductase-like enzyme
MSERITSPFGAKSTAREVVAGHDLSGKVAIVTGAATGIGVETARALALAGAEVIIAARKPELGEEVANAINEEAGPSGPASAWWTWPAWSPSATSPMSGATGRSIC